MRSFDLRIDLPARHGAHGDNAQIAVTIHAPDAEAMPDRPVVIFAIAGGGYARGYFDMQFDGHRGYSQAEHHAQRGIILAAIDPLGVGDSSLAQISELQFEDISRANNACVRKILDLFQTGAINGLGVISPGAEIGIGQSMGGCITILSQAHHHTFQAIAVLGYSVIQVKLPQQDPQHEALHQETLQHVERGTVGKSPRDAHLHDYVYPFHFEDVPAEIVRVDMEGGFPYRESAPPFGSMTLPNCAVQMVLPDVVKGEAASLDVPVFIANGERDVCENPHLEPSRYLSSPDITTTVIPSMAHMHNFASTREILWERLANWYHTVKAISSSGQIRNTDCSTS